MHFPRLFFVAFVAAGLLMFVHASAPGALEFGIGLGIVALFLGGFVALAIQVGAEFTGGRRLKMGGIVFVGFLLSIAALGWALGVLPYIWNGIAFLCLGLAMLILPLFLLWQCGRDYFEMLLHRQTPAGPSDWHRLETGDLPHADGKDAKERFRHSYELQITCVPRTSHHGMAAQPLRMDE